MSEWVPWQYSPLGIVCIQTLYNWLEKGILKRNIHIGMWGRRWFVDSTVVTEEFVKSCYKHTRKPKTPKTPKRDGLTYKECRNVAIEYLKTMKRIPDFLQPEIKKHNINTQELRSEMLEIKVNKQFQSYKFRRELQELSRLSA